MRPSMFHAPLVESVRKCKHLCAQIDYCFARCRIEGTCFSFELFSCLDMFRPRKRHSISEPSGVSFQPFCSLQVSGVIMLLLGTSWFKPRKIEIKPRSTCAGDKLASLLAHLTGTNSQGCQFPCWNCSGPLSFGLVHWFAIEHIEPPAAAWLREWLQLFRLEIRLPWPTHAESLTIVELGNEVFYRA